MTAHDEKAKELIAKFNAIICPEHDDECLKVEQCALAEVDGIIKSNDLEEYSELKPHVDSIEWTSDDNWIYNVKTKFWNGVRESILKSKL